jgi:hypothetical protein
MKIYLFFIVFIFILAGAFVLVSKNTALAPENVIESPAISNVLPEIVIKEARLNLEIADTDLERQRGLSGRKSLPEGTGLLFVFQETGAYSFWMKEMEFPIDIIWMDESGKIIYIEKSLSPNTYPNTFGPSEPALYVLETNSGWANKNGINVGDKAIINFK